MDPAVLRAPPRAPAWTSGSGFAFNCLARADSLTPELLRLMKRAGCHLVHMGVESASGDTLDRVGKRLTLPQVEAAVEECRRVGIAVLASYVLGLPWETRRTSSARSTSPSRSTPTTPPSTLRGADELGRPRRVGRPPCRATTTSTRCFTAAYCRFYFRPAYLLRQLRAAASPTALRLAAASGFEIFRRHAIPGSSSARLEARMRGAAR